MAERKERILANHILAIPLPLQGHVNPILQFSKRLASKGLRVTFLTTGSDSQALQSEVGGVRFRSISDWIESGDGLVENVVDKFRISVSKRLPEFIRENVYSENPFTCLVYDSAMPWALDIAKGLGLLCASFFTQSCAVAFIYYTLHRRGLLGAPIEDPIPALPGLPLLQKRDLPSLASDSTAYPSLLKVVISRFSNLDQADWILFNTFDCLEKEVLNCMASQWNVLTVGPNIPSIYLDKRLNNNKDYGLSLEKPNFEACMSWLDSMEEASVVYLSFGSMASVGKIQMEEIAMGLKKSQKHFLWVARDGEEQKLPPNFAEETSGKGLVVKWCPQLDVLAHKATGCFVTHCGWNSTLEALSLGVPMVGMPQWSDQTTNAKFVQDVWEAGVRAKVDERGIVTREEVENCIREVLEGEKREEIRNNSLKWKEVAKQAVDDGGSSDRNVDDFVAKLAVLSLQNLKLKS